MKEKTYAVDVHWTVARVLNVRAVSKDDAEDRVWDMIKRGSLSPRVSSWETTEDVEVDCSGEEDSNGDIKYY